MQTFLRELRNRYFTCIADIVGKQDIQFVVLTHLLDDRPELLEALSRIAPISLLIGIPYSIHQPTLELLQKTFPVETPSLDNLYDNEYLVSLVADNIDPDKPVVILEIGGYFAPLAKTLQTRLGGKLLGIIEDTEAGHRRYEEYLATLPCPVISVARSELKETEDHLVGSSCIYSTERMLRDLGFPLEGKSALVLGYGKVGKGVAYSLYRRHCPVAVYDINSIRRINALSEGFKVLNKRLALTESELIFGATGKCSVTREDFPFIKNGAMLISCSSKDTEFDLQYMRDNYVVDTVSDGIERFRNEQQVFYLLGQGRPINFRDGAVIGPVLSLVQAEIILAVQEILNQQGKNILLETSKTARETLADMWLHQFGDGSKGISYFDCAGIETTMNANDSQISKELEKA